MHALRTATPGWVEGCPWVVSSVGVEAGHSSTGGINTIAHLHGCSVGCVCVSTHIAEHVGVCSSVCAFTTKKGQVTKALCCVANYVSVQCVNYRVLLLWSRWQECWMSQGAGLVCVCVCTRRATDSPPSLPCVRPPPCAQHHKRCRPCCTHSEGACRANRHSQCTQQHLSPTQVPVSWMFRPTAQHPVHCRSTAAVGPGCCHTTL